MGQKQSTTEQTYNAITEVCATTMISNSMSCSSVVKVTQEMNITGYTAQELAILQSSPACLTCIGKNAPDQCATFCGGVTEVDGAVQDAIVNFSSICTQTVDARASLVANINQNIQQQMDKKDDGLFKALNNAVPGTNNETVANHINLSNKIDQIFSMDNIQTMMASLQTEQTLNITGNVKATGLRQSVAVTLLQEAIQKTTAAQELKADLTAATSQGLTEETSGIFTWLESPSGVIIIVVIVVVLAVAGWIAYKAKTKGA